MSNKIINKTKAFLFKITNRKALLFIFFFFLSALFWTALTLNEIQEEDIRMPIVITNVPKNIVLTSDSCDTINITIKDKGYILATYLLRKRLQPAMIDFMKYQSKNGQCTVQTSELQRLLHQQLFSSTRITAIKPEKYTFYFNYGTSKNVPVRFQGKVSAAENHFITETIITPDSVTIYASSEQLSHIDFVSIEPIYLQNITDTIHTTAKIERTIGLKSIPNSVKIEIIPDVLTEKVIEVDITCINLPKDKLLRTFPAKATVRFVVGASQYRDIIAEGFTVIVDYNEIKNTENDKCNLHLQAVPKGITKAQLEFDTADYLIEQL